MAQGPDDEVSTHDVRDEAWFFLPASVGFSDDEDCKAKERKGHADLWNVKRTVQFGTRQSRGEEVI